MTEAETLRRTTRVQTERINSQPLGFFVYFFILWYCINRPHITETSKVSELQNSQQYAPHLLKLITEQKIKPKELTPHQRRICIRFLLHERKHSMHEIAIVLHIDRTTVWRNSIRIAEEDKFILDAVDESKEALTIIKSAEVASARLFRKGKEKEAFEILYKKVDVLQSLGYLKRQAIEFTGAISIQEILKLAIDPKDENAFLGNTGQSSKNVITNGTH